MVRKRWGKRQEEQLAAPLFKHGTLSSGMEFDMVGKRKADTYARELRDINVSYSRRKVGARTWRFKK